MKLKTPWIPISMAVSTAMFIVSSASAQNIYVADYNNGTIYDYTPGGTQNIFYSGIYEIEGIAFDSSGNLYAASSGYNAIDKITPGGSESFFASVPDPNTIAINSSGDLYVSGYNSGDIYEISPNGSVSTFLTGLSQPCSMAFDSSGDLFFMSQANHSIYECKNVSGTLSTSYTLFASGLASPVGGLAFNSAGDLFAGDVSSGNGDILEFSPQKTTYATGLYQPTTIAFDSAGDMFVTDSDQGEVVEIAPNLTETDFANISNCTGIAIEGIVLPVPEPSTWALTALGTAGFWLRRKKN